MTTSRDVSLTRAQREALYRLWLRRQPYSAEDVPFSDTRRVIFRGYRAFRRTAHYDSIMGCIMVSWCGMWVGIESDGYTHT